MDLSGSGYRIEAPRLPVQFLSHKVSTDLSFTHERLDCESLSITWVTGFPADHNIRDIAGACCTGIRTFSQASRAIVIPHYVSPDCFSSFSSF